MDILTNQGISEQLKHLARRNGNVVPAEVFQRRRQRVLLDVAVDALLVVRLLDVVARAGETLERHDALA